MLVRRSSNQQHQYSYAFVMCFWVLKFTKKGISSQAMCNSFLLSKCYSVKANSLLETNCKVISFDSHSANEL